MKLTFNPIKLRKICICQENQIRNLEKLIEKLEHENRRLSKYNRELCARIKASNGEKKV